MDKEIVDWAIVADVKQKNWCVIPSETGTGTVIVNRVELVLPGELQSAIFLLINKYLNHKDTELLENTDFTN